MTIQQIIIIAILFVLWLIGFFQTANAIQHKTRSGIGFVKLNIVIVFLFCLIISLIISHNDKVERLKNKCPELEKVENVYIIKK